MRVANFSSCPNRYNLSASNVSRFANGFNNHNNASHHFADYSSKMFTIYCIGSLIIKHSSYHIGSTFAWHF
jgi:hypothetical protein